MSSYWLMKAEPDSRVVKGKDLKFSVDDFEEIQITPWEGVRSHEAKNKMKSMKLGDKVLFYHSNCKNPGIAGLAEVHKEAYPDYTAWDAEHPYFDAKSSSESPTWYMVDLKFTSRIAHFIPLSLLKHLHTCSLVDLPQIHGPLPDAEESTTSGENTSGVLSYLTEEDLGAIQTMALLNRGRLSVQSVELPAFTALIKMGEKGGWEGFKLGKTSKPKAGKAIPVPKGERKPRNTRGKGSRRDGEDDEDTEDLPASEAHSEYGEAATPPVKTGNRRAPLRKKPSKMAESDEEDASMSDAGSEYDEEPAIATSKRKRKAGSGPARRATRSSQRKT